LPPELAQKLVDQHSEVMARHGYLPERCGPVAAADDCGRTVTPPNLSDHLLRATHDTA
jgi:hypothetical protein